MKCTPKNLIRDLEFLKKFDIVPGMENRDDLIKFIRTYGYYSIKGVKSLEEAANEQLFATANRIYNSIFKRLVIYQNNLNVALSDWNLNKDDKQIILEINEGLRSGENKEVLEDRLYKQLEHLPENYPLYELFKVLSKNY